MVEDLQKLRDSTRGAIDGINAKMSLMMDFFTAKFPELKEGEKQAWIMKSKLLNFFLV